jgi:1-phosphofructokinase family hexose kinase
MILTVTPNTALDLTLFLDHYIADRVIRARLTALSVAGKPVDASYVLGEMGIPNVSTGFAAGVFGQKLVNILEKKNCQHDFVWVNGETRINPIIIDDSARTATTLTSDSLIISQADQNALLKKVREYLRFADCLITGGSLPSGMAPEFYGQLIRMTREAGVPVVFDGSGENLRVGIKEKPTLIKPNRAELSQFVGREIRDLQDAYQAARWLFETTGVGIVATLGEQGAVAVFPEGTFRLLPLDVPEIVSAAGAGDAMLAGLSIALSTRSPLDTGLILGGAAASAVLLTAGTADCRRDDILQFLPDVRVQKIS